MSCALLFLFGSAQSVYAFDLDAPFHDPLQVLSPKGQSASLTAGCTDLKTSADTAWTLSAVVASSLCHNPKSREAWAVMQQQAAQVGVAQSAYLPTLSANGQLVRDIAHSQGNNTNGKPFDFSAHSTNHNAAVNLSWVLYDFGLRSANLDNAEQTLRSALAKQDGTLQTIIGTTVKDYYTAQVAQKNIAANRLFEDSAKQVLDMTIGRVKGGVSAISDQLQAQTAYSQAVYNRQKAEGDWQSALGVLAVDMGARPNTTFRLSEADDVGSAPAQAASVESLLTSAAESHPSLRAARADLAASEANERAIRAQGRPSLSLVGQYNTSKQAESAGGDLPYLVTQRSERYVGVKLDVPLFEGFGRTYKIRTAEAQTAEKAATLNEAELAVAVNVWTTYQQVVVTAGNIQISKDIVDAAKQALDAAQSRYQHGVTDIRELTNAQNTYADAIRQNIKAIADWHNARIQLAASLGQLDLSSIQ